MSDFALTVCEEVTRSELAFCRFITAIDMTIIKTRQTLCVVIPERAADLLFSSPVKKGVDQERRVKIKWQDGSTTITTDSRFVYHSQGDKDEYYITDLGDDFPFLDEDHVGCVYVIAKQSEDYYTVFVLQTDDDFDDLFACFTFGPDSTNRIFFRRGVPMSELE